MSSLPDPARADLARGWKVFDGPHGAAPEPLSSRPGRRHRRGRAAEQRVGGWSGAPQTRCTDHFLGVAPIEEPIGYKLEAPPTHPIVLSRTVTGFGAEQATAMKQFPQTHALLGLLRDGFYAFSVDGKVGLRSDGLPEPNYSLHDFVTDGARRVLSSKAEIQFAAGAKGVTPSHELARPDAIWAETPHRIAPLPTKPLLTRIFSAHVMGGCGIAGRAEQSVVQPDGRHWQVEGLSVHDGAHFLTCVGANPQLSIYGLVVRLATWPAPSLSGREVRLA